MNQRPITEDDLHGYVDQALSPERRVQVASYLDEHPDVRERVAGFADQRKWLRTALAPIAEEPVPASLNLSRMIESRRRHVPVRWAIAAMLLLCIGGAFGWDLRGSLQPAPGGLAALAQEASDSFNVYAPDHVRPVEMRASDRAELVDWVSSRLHRTVKVPDLSPSGYRLMGGRLIATSHGPAAMFMYDNDRGSRIVMLTRPMNRADRNAPMTARSNDDVAGFSWADGGTGYSIVGQAPVDLLKPLADEARKQLSSI
jgi:anti-sigma factor RsiW